MAIDFAVVESFFSRRRMESRGEACLIRDAGEIENGKRRARTPEKIATQKVT
jgi:hypothetical protein